MKIDYVSVFELKALDGFCLWLRFSNGAEGTKDFTDLLAEGGEVIEPLRDPAMFSRVFLSFGVPTWPSGLQIDPSNLHHDLKLAGSLTPAVAAE